MITQKTLVFFKPDVFETKCCGKVISEFEANNITIIAQKTLRLKKEEAEEFYRVHRGKPFYDGLVQYVTRGQILAMVLEGDDVIARVRKLMGATNPKDADKDTIRGKYGASLDANVIHGSDSVEATQYEIPFFFSHLELMRT